MLKDKLESLTSSFVDSLLDQLQKMPLNELLGGGDNYGRTGKKRGRPAKTEGGDGGSTPGGGKKYGKRGNVDSRVQKLVAEMKANPDKTGHIAENLRKAVHLSQNQWSTVIERAKSQKLVMQKGNRRGARYFLRLEGLRRLEIGKIGKKSSKKESSKKESSKKG